MSKKALMLTVVTLLLLCVLHCGTVNAQNDPILPIQFGTYSIICNGVGTASDPEACGWDVYKYTTLGTYVVAPGTSMSDITNALCNPDPGCDSSPECSGLKIIDSGHFTVSRDCDHHGANPACVNHMHVDCTFACTDCPCSEVNVEGWGQCTGKPGHWGGEPYAFHPKTDNVSICGKGCALTSLSMALNAAGIETFPDPYGSNDPGHLDDLMKSWPAGSGYNTDSNVLFGPTVSNLNFILRYSGLLEKTLTFTTPTGELYSSLDKALCAGHPVIVRVTHCGYSNKGKPCGSNGLVNCGGHYVLVTGKQDDDYYIQDPSGDERFFLSEYLDDALGKECAPQDAPFFQIRGYVQDPPGDASALYLSLGDNADLLVTDPTGNRTGFDTASGNDVRNIPESVHFVDDIIDDETFELSAATHSVNISQPQAGIYKVEIAGIKPGQYTLLVGAFSQDGSPQPVLSGQGIDTLQGSVQTGSLITYQIEFSPDDYSTTIVTLDTTQTVPGPNPMTWVTPPVQTGIDSISMVATTATDPVPLIDYYFDFVDSPTEGMGAVSSGWQTGSSYTNSGLQPNHQYGYRVKARNGANNETNYSTPTEYAYTAIEAPIGISLGAVNSTSIQVQSINTPSGLSRGGSGLLIENITDSTTSVWKQDNSYWVSTPLFANTGYSFRAKARNGDSIQTGYSPILFKYTLANAPGTLSFLNVTETCIRINWSANGNPDGTEYSCENTTNGTGSGWTTDTSWDSCGLASRTLYSFRVKARNTEGVETDWTLGRQSTAYLFPFFDDFSTDKGWIGYEPGGWERGPAVVGGGENGMPDPGTDYSSTSDNYILGFAIGGDYPNDLVEKSIISPPIDCTGKDRVLLKFRRYLNVESNKSDHAGIYISTNGKDWTQVWENPPIDLTDDQWLPAVLDISSTAANQSTVYIRFEIGPTNFSRRFSGWNIDDLEVTSEGVCPSEGTVGTNLSIYGSNFGTKRGKVLTGATPLKVQAWNSDSIQVQLTKPMNPGVYDVTIRLRDPKATLPVIEKNAFILKTPEIFSVAPNSGLAGDQIRITGQFFGTKKGKVYFEYEDNGTTKRKNCKVLSWNMDAKTGESAILFTVPKGMTPGTYPLKITNSVGEDTGEFTIVP